MFISYGQCQKYVFSINGGRVFNSLAISRLFARSVMSSGENTFVQHRRSTASVIVIGDEILKGQVQDTNSSYLAKQLRLLGVKLEKISVVPDCVEAIGAEVRQQADRHDLVITTGGVGPTHDDVTFQGVAAAFGDTVALNSQLASFVADYFHTDNTEQPCFKLARIPTTARLLYGEDRARGARAKFPVVNVQNVYIFPGVPSLFEKAFSLLANEYFRNPDCSFHCATVYLCLDEVCVAAAINSVVAKLPHITFGSYPQLYHSYYKTRITIESSCTEMLDVARRELIAALPDGAVVNYNADAAAVDAWRHLQPLAETSRHVAAAIGVFDQCMDQYSWDEICLCFNGGKDCTAVLHMLHAVACQRGFVSAGARRPLRAVYVRDAKPFPELETFVDETCVRYGLELFTTAGPIRVGLERMMLHWPGVRACVMGTRRGDPHSDKMLHFTPTDAGWPQLMRVSPILEWSYGQLWQFVRRLSLAYCPLYDRGYTSLGSIDNTLPNPALQYQRGDSSVAYRPAHELTDGSLERAGRTKRLS